MASVTVPFIFGSTGTYIAKISPNSPVTAQHVWDPEGVLAAPVDDLTCIGIDLRTGAPCTRRLAAAGGKIALDTFLRTLKGLAPDRPQKIENLMRFVITGRLCRDHTDAGQYRRVLADWDERRVRALTKMGRGDSEATRYMAARLAGYRIEHGHPNPFLGPFEGHQHVAVVQRGAGQRCSVGRGSLGQENVLSVHRCLRNHPPTDQMEQLDYAKEPETKGDDQVGEEDSDSETDILGQSFVKLSI
ncbi:hypothetical protein CTA2_461 [Colletotrichum tanaceti]|uniref:Uncharacterized protein n=1 Tax=Colletotrichum tanaceti TaxID=1306861 RepID=A0A4V6DFF1_9PEZI|nr:hypothetical protein CTA2_461 [Colletotrichum tanaceti]TKW48926.1 hypothetical protein CTA1_11150 [Colletotrichum tanaceti]